MSSDGELLESLVGDIGSSLESSMITAVTDPVIGWVAAIFGLDEGGSDGAPALAELQADLFEIMQEISNVESDLVNAMNDIVASSTIQPAVTAVENYQNTGTPPGSILLLPKDWLYSPLTSGLLTTVHDTLVGTAQGSTPYLTSFRQTQVPRYISDSSPKNQMLDNFFAYHQNLQASLMQMNVEAAHQGQSANTQADLTDTSGSLPPNYVAAIQAYDQYLRQTAQQTTFLPQSTSGIGYRNLGLLFAPNNNGKDLGAYQTIVFDQQTGYAWGSQNILMCWGAGATVPALRAELKNPFAWMMRAPTYAELAALYTSLNPAGQTPTAAGMLTSLQNIGFTLRMDPTLTVSVPLVTAEVFDQTNWTTINQVWSKHKPPSGTIVANGYQCDKFYDLLNGVPVTVQIHCDVTVDVFSGPGGFGTSGNLEFFSTIPDSASVTAVSSAGTLALSSYNTEYADGLFIYQLAAADPATSVTTDPPLEEPASLQITPVTNPDGSVTCTASASFNRLQSNGTIASLLLTVPNVYWSVDDLQAATIDQNGHLTWKTGTLVHVTAKRGSTTEKIPVGPPTTFMPPPAPTPCHVNIYPRNVLVDGSSLPQTIAFSGQILFSDGSTSPIADGVADDTQFTWSASENIQLVPNTPRIDSISHVLVPAQFVIPAGTTATVTITLTLNNSQLHDTATITIG